MFEGGRAIVMIPLVARECSWVVARAMSGYEHHHRPSSPCWILVATVSYEPARLPACLATWLLCPPSASLQLRARPPKSRGAQLASNQSPPRPFSHLSRRPPRHLVVAAQRYRQILSYGCRAPLLQCRRRDEQQRRRRLRSREQAIIRARAGLLLRAERQTLSSSPPTPSPHHNCTISLSLASCRSTSSPSRARPSTSSSLPHTLSTPRLVSPRTARHATSFHPNLPALNPTSTSISPHPHPR